MDPFPLRTADGASRKPTIALALGAGGAKGLAHIGVIEELQRAGFEIVAIAGSSMGALIGGIHAAGKLDVYRDWVCALQKIDVLRLVDWSLSRGGLIKGERIVALLRDMIGEIDIEALPIEFTAVATDIDRQREVWLTRGPLFDAIRASIAIPTLFRPQRIDDRRLVDGGLMNPVPLAPLLRARSDYIVAVGVNGPEQALAPQREASAESPRQGLRHKLAALIGRHRHEQETERARSWLETMTEAIDLMQHNLAQLKLAVHQPDLLIELPRNVSTAYEFYRAREIIEQGREHARRALARWPALHLSGADDDVKAR
ncbi:MAG: patatin-like phospholipase family protein [Proteobacteria bacterium]|nr:patatin-like phospholipase family protein [Pseudomonadota bacterium]